MKLALMALAVLFVLTPVAAFPQDVIPSTRWTTIRSDDDGFSLEAPETFKYRRDEVLGRFDQGRGEYISDGVYLYAFVDRVKKRLQSEFVEAFVKANRQAGAVENFGGQQITKYEFRGDDGFFHTVVFNKSETRSFAFHAVGRTAHDPSVARFIKSIRFGPETNEMTPAKVEPKPAAPRDDLNLDFETVSPGPPEGGTTQYGIGSGNGTGSGVGPGPANSVTSKLKILSKQKAQYTDLARFYNITGNVLLRVTFMANNRIGAIRPIKALPFGLTESAISAARGMRFEAEITNGQPRTTTRPVSFMFNIY